MKNRMSFSNKLIFVLIIYFLMGGNLFSNIFLTANAFGGLILPSYMKYLVLLGVFLLSVGVYSLFSAKQTKINSFLIGSMPIGFVLLATQFMNVIHQLFIQRLSMEPMILYTAGNIVLILLGVVSSIFIYWRVEHYNLGETN